MQYEELVRRAKAAHEILSPVASLPPTSEEETQEPPSESGDPDPEPPEENPPQPLDGEQPPPGDRDHSAMDEIPARPPMPDVRAPSDVAWRFEGNRIIRVHDGLEITGSHLIQKAFREHTHGRPFSVGLISDYPWPIKVSHTKDGVNDPELLAHLMPNGHWAPIHFTLVGGGKRVERLELNELYGEVDKVAYHDVRIRGPRWNDGRCVNQFGDISGRLVLDDFELLQHPNATRLQHGIYLGYSVPWMMIRGRKHRPDPANGNALPRFYHHFVYDMGLGESWFINNDLAGGGRTGRQRRPQAVPYYGQVSKRYPSGPSVWEANYCADGGWDSPWAQGGSRMTSWASPDHPVWFIDNEITNDRYGCCAISHQGPDNGNFLNRGGWTHSYVYFQGNTFHNPAGDRAALSISSCAKAFVDEKNRILSPDGYAQIALDGVWERERGAPPVGELLDPGTFSVSRGGVMVP